MISACEPEKLGGLEYTPRNHKIKVCCTESSSETRAAFFFFLVVFVLLSLLFLHELREAVFTSLDVDRLYYYMKKNAIRYITDDLYFSHTQSLFKYLRCVEAKRSGCFKLVISSVWNSHRHRL